MNRLLLVAALLLGIVGARAQSDLLLMGVGVAPKGGAAAYTGPGDVQATGWVSFYSCRAFSKATAGTQAYRIINETTTVQTDINSLSSGLCDTATPASFCSGATCKIVTYYDQSTSALCNGTCNITNATDAGRPPWTANSLNGWPCATNNQNNAITLQSVSLASSISEPFTFVGLGERAGSPTITQVLVSVNSTNSFIGWRNSANTFGTQSGTITATANDNAFHAFMGIYITGLGNSSVVVDGVPTAGTLVVTLATAGIGAMGTGSANGMNGTFCEGGLLSVGLTPTQYAALNSNMHSAWNF